MGVWVFPDGDTLRNGYTQNRKIVDLQGNFSSVTDDKTNKQRNSKKEEEWIHWIQMARTFGAKDKKKRKRKKDSKYTYRKKLSRVTGSPYFKKYESQRSKGDPVKVWFWVRKAMSREGYYNWNKNLRAKINPNVWYPIDKPFYIYPHEISNPDKIAALAKHYIQYGGYFQMRMRSKRKNKGGGSYVKKVTFIIEENLDSGELDVKIIESWRMSRYWFWEGSQKQ